MSRMSKKNGRPKKPDGRKISKRLNTRQRRFVVEYTNPESAGFGNQTKAAELAGYSPGRAKQTGHDIVTNRDVRTEIERVTEREITRIFDAAGVTTEKLAKRTNQALDAKETKPFIHQKTGKVVYSKRMIAHDIRLKAIRLAAELRGDMAPKEINVSVAVLAGRLDAAKRRERARQVQGVRVEENDNNRPKADNLGGALQAEDKTKEVKLLE